MQIMSSVFQLSCLCSRSVAIAFEQRAYNGVKGWKAGQNLSYYMKAKVSGRRGTVTCEPVSSVTQHRQLLEQLAKICFSVLIKKKETQENGNRGISKATKIFYSQLNVMASDTFEITI